MLLDGMERGGGNELDLGLLDMGGQYSAAGALFL